ncbi:hypothetical protein ACFSEO_00875 [Agromyces cerinus subsp. nitratus]|uniref:hypothetical protein n=1 Tax=Agromyces cerinus TaxID=33878 RepID=UPI003632A021
MISGADHTYVDLGVSHPCPAPRSSCGGRRARRRATARDAACTDAAARREGPGRNPGGPRMSRRTPWAGDLDRERPLPEYPGRSSCGSTG